MIEFGKYERNIMYAEAIKQVGERVEYFIEDTKEDIERYQKYIDNKLEENKDDPDFNPDDDWNIRGYTRSKAVCESVLSLYKKIASRMVSLWQQLLMGNTLNSKEKSSIVAPATSTKDISDHIMEWR